MVGKLKRLSGTTQTALQQLACLGNVVEFATLTLVHGESEEEIHTALWEAARAGLILRLDDSYAFLHDRIQEAAYALIPEGERAGAHLRIGRVLLASMTADGLAEHLFDVANQLNRGAALLIDRDEKVACGGDRSECRTKGQGVHGLCVGAACIFRPAWRYWTKGTGTASTS